MIPETFRGNLGNCMIAVEFASRTNSSPLMVMQNMFVIHGRPSLSAKFLIATFNASGKYSPIRYEQGEDGCTAITADVSTGEVIRGPKITWAIVNAEGWNKKNGSKWITMPDLMFRYRAATWMINTVDPGISMGMTTDDEARDIATVTAVDRITATQPHPEPIQDAEIAIDYSNMDDALSIGELVAAHAAGAHLTGTDKADWDARATANRERIEHQDDDSDIPL